MNAYKAIKDTLLMLSKINTTYIEISFDEL